VRPYLVSPIWEKTACHRCLDKVPRGNEERRGSDPLSDPPTDDVGLNRVRARHRYLRCLGSPRAGPGHKARRPEHRWGLIDRGDRSSGAFIRSSSKRDTIASWPRIARPTGSSRRRFAGAFHVFNLAEVEMLSNHPRSSRIRHKHQPAFNRSPRNRSFPYAPVCLLIACCTCNCTSAAWGGGALTEPHARYRPAASRIVQPCCNTHVAGVRGRPNWTRKTRPIRAIRYKPRPLRGLASCSIRSAINQNSPRHSAPETHLTGAV